MPYVEVPSGSGADASSTHLRQYLSNSSVAAATAAAAAAAAAGVAAAVVAAVVGATEAAFARSHL